jgi:hypothetical protein
MILSSSSSLSLSLSLNKINLNLNYLNNVDLEKCCGMGDRYLEVVKN